MSESVSRRDFLAAGVVAAGTLAGASKMYAQTSQTRKVGLIGCGGRGTGALVNVLDSDKDVQITALCDAFEPQVTRALTGIKKKYGDRVAVTPESSFVGLDGYKKLIAHPDVNYVMIDTTPGFRPDHLEAAVEDGKNIFNEKPAGVEVAGIR